jgi:beta-lactamase regulating signal transducer with metallopeptidase domain
MKASDLINVFGLLVDSALKGIFLVAAAAIAAYLLRNRSAAARHAAWTAAVIGHLALPAITLLAPAWRLPFLPAPPWLTAQVEQSTPAVTTTSSPTTTATPTPAQPVITAPSSVDVTPASSPTTPRAIDSLADRFRFDSVSLLGAVWILGVVVVLLRLAFGTFKVGQLAREGSRVIDGAWLSLAQHIAIRLGITRPLTLLHGDRLGIPVTWGIVYPAVLLPTDADEWPEERRRFVLVHEMAHVKRFDALTQLAAQFALALFWFDPLIWLAAHRMRVEREHACDDYVLRDGTRPSLYAGELLEMVRSIGTPSHERAAPAFAALAMARRSEFEGRMLAILDPKLDRHTLDRRSTMITFVLVALLVLPLAALRPFEQPKGAKLRASGTSPTAAKSPTEKSTYTCDAADLARKGTATHVGLNIDDKTGELNLRFMVNTTGRCAEATLDGRPSLTPDETRVLAVEPGGLARFREVLPGSDRSVLMIPSVSGGVIYTATANGHIVDFDSSMQAWLSRLMPEILREAGMDAPQRVARVRRQGGVGAVLDLIAGIRSTSAKAEHYKALLKSDDFTQSEIDRIAREAAGDLASSPSDLRAVMDVMLAQTPSRRQLSPAAKAAIRESIQTAFDSAKSSGDKASILLQYAAGGDEEAVRMALRGAKEVMTDGDKSNLLRTLASPALSGNNASLRRAFFDAYETIASDGDKRNVLTAAAPYGHANPAVTLEVIKGTRHIDSAGDKAEVLIYLAQQRLLTSSAIRTAFLDAAKLITSSGDYTRVMQAALQQ